MPTLENYAPRGRAEGPINNKDLHYIRTAFLDHHKGLIDAHMMAAVMTQYIDLLIEAARNDIRRRAEG